MRMTKTRKQENREQQETTQRKKVCFHKNNNNNNNTCAHLQEVKAEQEDFFSFVQSAWQLMSKKQPVVANREVKHLLSGQ